MPEVGQDISSEVNHSFDSTTFLKVARLENSLFDYGLNENQKKEVVGQLNQSDVILIGAIEHPQYRKRAMGLISNLFSLNDNIHELNGYGFKFVERNINQLGSLVNKESDYGEKKKILDLILRLSQSEDKQKHQLLTSKMQQVLEHEASTTPQRDESDEQKEKRKLFISSFQNIFQLGSDQQVVETTKFLAKKFDQVEGNKQKNHIGVLVANTIWSDKQSTPFALKTQASRELATHVLKHYNLNYDQFVKQWYNYSLQTGQIGMVAQNLEAILTIEEKRPDIAKVLKDEFNIGLFHRYPPEVLIAQFDQRNNRELPFGIMVNSITDHNEALGSLGMTGLLKSLHKEADGVGYGVRIYEAGSIEEIVDIMNQSNERYGEKTPQFALISGHGLPDSIEMDWDHPRFPGRKIRQESFQDEDGLNLAKKMGDNAQVILISCSTGVEGGIAQEISKQGLRVSGPDCEAGAGWVEMKKTQDGLIEVQVKYRGAKTNRYQNGELLAEAA